MNPITPAQKKEVWAYINWIIACEQAAYERNQNVARQRERCLRILRSETLTDEDALKTVKQLLA